VKGEERNTMDFGEEETSEVDNGVLPFISNDESEESEEIETRDDINPPAKEETPEQDGEDGEGGKPPAKTEKGTNLDPNPLSAAHQQLANERRLRENYEKVLSSPELLRRFAKESGMTLEEAKEEIKDAKDELYTPERFKSAQDVADALNELKGGFTKATKELREENQRLRGELSGISSSRQLERVTSSMQSDIASVREKYPQLNPKSPEYDKDLENEIGSFYHELDAVDPSDPSKGYRGQFSIARITERFMRVRGEGARRGSQKAQTDVKIKQSGRVVTTSKTSSKDESRSSDPGTSIAQKVARALAGSN